MMFYKRFCLLVLLVMFCGSYSKIAPDYIVPCPGLTSECLKKNIQDTIPHFVKGLPHLGIDSTDPLQQDRVDLELPGGLKIEFTNGTMTGFRKCTVDSIKYEDLEAQFSVTCSLLLKGKYKATGRVLIFAINGDGDAKVKSSSVTLNAKVKFEDRVRDGVTYREVKDYKVTYTYNDRVSFVFTNLFKGNTELSQTVLAFLNENWKQVVDEFGKPIVDTIIRLAFNVIKKFFHSIPRDELFVS